MTTAVSTPAGTSAATAAELLASLRTIFKRMERTPVSSEPRSGGKWSAGAPAPRHIAALMQIVADERMSVTTLSARLGVSLATASQVVTDLEDAELVERVEDPSDRRRTLVQIAESRRAFADAVLDTRLRPVQRALDRMRPAERRALVRGLELVAEELGHPTDV
ncbi:MAG TPA: MarR family transcriptional regulator [Mycobacteriales bacterium]|nr:MarR family transcriptional regulator [Mycobacteriales bacterium]